MRVVHVGPPLARTGGPSGYLLQLSAAFAQTGTGGHSIVLPAIASHATLRVGSIERLRRLAGRAKRRVLGQPRQYRPPVEELCERHGRVEGYENDTRAAALESVAPMLAAAQDAELLFAHDPAVAERLLLERRDGQQVWLFAHSPMPTAVYLTWNWVMPELEWREIAEWPDVRAWMDWELGIWNAVDRVVTATPDALDELARIDERFRTAAHMEYAMTGASAATPSKGGRSRAEIRNAWSLPLDQPVGLYLGSIQQYRGFDRLIAGLDRLSDQRVLPGIIAVAGPPPAAIASHPRIRALGHVSDVGELMRAVDFFVNVNRFNLFDLSLIEAAEVGLPLLLHMTGGNRTFASLGAGLVTIPDLSATAVAHGIDEMLSMAPSQRAGLAAQSRACYEAHLTPAHMARRHLALYDVAATA